MFVMSIVAVVVFLMLRLAPGDPAGIIAGPDATSQQVEKIRDSLGLNEPIYVQFGMWTSNLLRGDFGTSILSGKPITELVAQRIEPTLLMAAMTMGFAVMLSIPMGVFVAWKMGTIFDRIVMLFSVAGFSVPVFVVGYVLIYVFSMQLHWFPVQGYVEISKNFWGCIHSLLLPSFTLSWSYVALITRITRTSMIEVLSSDYVRTAKAKGVGIGGLLFVHGLRNASIPVVTVIGIGVALLIGGVVVTETVYNLPGLGRLTVDAIMARDYPIIQALIILFSGVYVLVNLGVDLLYTVLDPRIRY